MNGGFFPEQFNYVNEISQIVEWDINKSLLVVTGIV